MVCALLITPPHAARATNAPIAEGRAGNLAAAPGRSQVPVFTDAPILFSPDSLAYFAAPGVEYEDNGRLIETEVDLPRFEEGTRITAVLAIKPVPKDERSVFDRWDRAGSIRLRTDGRPDLELVRFVTAYGGRTDYTVEVSHLAPLLRGRVRIAAFIDTWVAPAWRIDLALRVEPDSTVDNATWAAPAIFVSSLNLKEGDGSSEAVVEVPADLRRVVLLYLSTGHCTDGRDADEFVSKANVISIDGRAVHRFHPWRNDCRRYREINPYTTRWTDGSWSSDYSRSGWCPGLEVQPVEIDLTDHLGPGRHTLRVAVEGIRPPDEAGHYGYWRISGFLLGWDHEPELWRNW